MNSPLRTVFRSYEALTKAELYELLWLRDRVFVVGQKITAESEIDGEDPNCSHMLAYRGDDLVACARFATTADGSIRVGRIAVDPVHQRAGLGTALMHAVHDQLGDRSAQMHAQAYLRTWYESLGWRVTGPMFMEAEIEHLPMERP